MSASHIIKHTPPNPHPPPLSPFLCYSAALSLRLCSIFAGALYPPAPASGRASRAFPHRRQRTNAHPFLCRRPAGAPLAPLPFSVDAPWRPLSDSSLCGGVEVDVRRPQHSSRAGPRATSMTAGP
jgi:hypothetical protein